MEHLSEARGAVGARPLRVSAETCYNTTAFPSTTSIWEQMLALALPGWLGFDLAMGVNLERRYDGLDMLPMAS